MRPAKPQHHQRGEAEAPYGRHHADHDGRVMAAAQQDRQQVVLGGDDPGERDIAPLTAMMLARIAAPVEPRILGPPSLPSAAHSRAREAEIRRARSCRARPWSAGRRRAARRREQTGKGEGVDDRRGGGEQISAREQQQRPRAQDRELRKQQDRGDEIVDGERGLIARDECRDRGSGIPANGTAQANRTAETPTTARAARASRRVAGMVERKMLRSSPIIRSGKLASNAPWQ